MSQKNNYKITLTTMRDFAKMTLTVNYLSLLLVWGLSKCIK